MSYYYWGQTLLNIISKKSKESNEKLKFLDELNAHVMTIQKKYENS